MLVEKGCFQTLAALNPSVHFTYIRELVIKNGENIMRMTAGMDNWL
jgi:hypothetical protein